MSKTQAAQLKDTCMKSNYEHFFWLFLITTSNSFHRLMRDMKD